MVALSKNIEQMCTTVTTVWLYQGSTNGEEEKKTQNSNNEVKWVQLIIDLGIVEIPFQL